MKKNLKKMMYLSTLLILFSGLFSLSQLNVKAFNDEDEAILESNEEVENVGISKSWNSESEEVILDNGKTVTVIIGDEFQEELTPEMIDDLILDNHLVGGETITILEISSENEFVELVDKETRGYQYTTNLTNFSAEKALGNDYFIISVAKGATKKLTTAFSKTVSTKIDVGTGKDSPFKLSGGLEKSKTHNVSKEKTFSGPPESSKANSREYRVKYYGKSFTWTQTRKNTLTGKVEKRKGTGVTPTKTLEYSLDHVVKP